MMNNETKLCKQCGTKPVARPSDRRSLFCGATCVEAYDRIIHNTDDGYDAYRDLNRGAFRRWS